MTFSYKSLLAEAPRGTPLSTSWLASKGLEAKHASYLAATGWLLRLGRGVYALPGDTLDRDASVAFLATVIPGLHVAGQTALSWRGVRHQIAFDETLVLWGNSPANLPAWFTERFRARYQSTLLFDARMPTALGISSTPAGRPDLPVSTPERALLELLSDVGRQYALASVRDLMASTTALRIIVLEELMGHLKRIKVARLADELAESLDLPWKDVARRASMRLGGGRRWVAVGRTGERLNLRRPA